MNTTVTMPAKTVRLIPMDLYADLARLALHTLEVRKRNRNYRGEKTGRELQAELNDSEDRLRRTAEAAIALKNTTPALFDAEDPPPKSMDCECSDMKSAMLKAAKLLDSYGSEVGRNRDAWKARLILVQYLEDEDFEQKQPSDPLPTKQQVREYLEVMLQGVRMRQDVFEFTKPEDQVEAWEDAESIGHVIDLLDAALGDKDSHESDGGAP